VIWDLVIDALLIAGFGVQHSIMATLKVKARVTRSTGVDPLTWRTAESFVNVTYILSAIALWQPVHNVVWNVTGGAGIVLGVVCALSWLWYFELHIFEYDSSMAFGSSGFVSRLIGRRPPPPELWKVGSRKWIRFPVHTAFFPMFLAFPHMDASTLLFGIVINVYNIIGSILYDKRLEKLGKPYRAYQAVSGLLFPRLSVPRGAADLEMAGPRHWERPLQYALPFALGVAGGLVYYAALGALATAPGELAASAGVAVGLALVAGVVLGVTPKRQVCIDPRGLSYAQLQARVGTAAAIVSATALIVWFAVAALSTGHAPYVGVVLPLWLIVLWIGHVVSFMVGYGAVAREPDAAGSLVASEPAAPAAPRAPVVAASTTSGAQAT
jgi:hypothetical protein